MLFRMSCLLQQPRKNVRLTFLILTSNIITNNRVLTKDLRIISLKLAKLIYHVCANYLGQFQRHLVRDLNPLLSPPPTKITHHCDINDNTITRAFTNYWRV